ncbi:MAG: methyltransferase domain-containing protein [Myxococcales bacterium]|nr:methyltransferase domain-containing protein [Myxococcales bacterium]
MPRVVLLLFDVPDTDALRKTLDRIPESAEGWLEEVVVMEGVRELPAPRPAHEARFDVLVHRSPEHAGEPGYGRRRKDALEYAVRRGFDIAVQLRAGLHPPELLPALLAPLLDGPPALSVARRTLRRSAADDSRRPLWRGIAGALASGLMNRLLGIRQHDHASSYRAIPVPVLSRIPFQLNSDDVAFESEFLIQCRALGLPTHEVDAKTSWPEQRALSASLLAGCAAIGSALDYRFHQLHLTRRGRYLVDTGVQYTLKQSSTSSHAQIAAAVAADSRILDLGCSQGLLARPLKEKGVRVTGVDIARSESLAAELAEFHAHDLEQPLDLPLGRVFDYVVVSDVLEHLKERQQLLRDTRRYLKEDGRLIVSTPNIALWFYRLSLLVGRFEYGARGVLDRTHVHLYTRSTFRREIERAGFRVVDQRVTALPFEVVFDSTGRSRLIRGLADAYHLLARAWPELFAYQFILEATITTLDEEAVSS